MQQLSVLVVDDDKEVCDYLGAFLTHEGYFAHCLTDPTLAIGELRESKYHIVILDLLMPKLSGLELLAKIRHIDSDIVVILLTGHPSFESATESIALDVAAYITKPATTAELRNTLQRAIRKKGLVLRREEELHLAIGRTIRHLRKERKRTLKRMARLTGLSVSLLSQIERAESNASVSTLLKVANALGVKFSDLFGDY